jgi:hypothetical protein
MVRRQPPIFCLSRWRAVWAAPRSLAAAPLLASKWGLGSGRDFAKVKVGDEVGGSKVGGWAHSRHALKPHFGCRLWLSLTSFYSRLSLSVFLCLSPFFSSSLVVIALAFHFTSDLACFHLHHFPATRESIGSPHGLPRTPTCRSTANQPVQLGSKTSPGKRRLCSQLSLQYSTCTGRYNNLCPAPTVSVWSRAGTSTLQPWRRPSALAASAPRATTSAPCLLHSLPHSPQVRKKARR